MTVQYYDKVLTGGPIVFFRLLAKWRGCVFKLIYLDLIVFLTAYAAMSCVYRFAMPEERKRGFERAVIYVYNFQSLIPVAFILGFYVTLVFGRFWKHFLTIPWAIKVALSLATHLPGTDEQVRLMRRTVVRYLNAALVITATRLHVVAKKRFPTNQHIVDAGILNQNEMEILDKIEPAHARPYIPIAWATAIITRAEKEGRITNHHALVNLINDVNVFRQGLLNLFMMDRVCVPLVYTQVVTLAVYSYFVSCIVGRQFIVNDSPLLKAGQRDVYFPIFTVLEFIVYIGWLKVAETLVNPMGEDDEDFDINEVIDYNWKVTLSIVDEMKLEPPGLVKDIHWDSTVIELPHTEESKKFVTKPYLGSVYNLQLDSTSDLGSLHSISVRSHDQGSFGEGETTDWRRISTTSHRSSTRSRRNTVTDRQPSGHIDQIIEEVEEIEMDDQQENDPSVMKECEPKGKEEIPKEEEEMCEPKEEEEKKCEPKNEEEKKCEEGGDADEKSPLVGERQKSHSDDEGDDALS